MYQVDGLLITEFASMSKLVKAVKASGTKYLGEPQLQDPNIWVIDVLFSFVG